MDWEDELHERPVTPEILVLWLERGRWSLSARHSETNDADDAESRMALQPPGAIQQVMSNRSDWSPIVAFVEMGVV